MRKVVKDFFGNEESKTKLVSVPCGSGQIDSCYGIFVVLVNEVCVVVFLTN